MLRSVAALQCRHIRINSRLFSTTRAIYHENPLVGTKTVLAFKRQLNADLTHHPSVQL